MNQSLAPLLVGAGVLIALSACVPVQKEAEPAVTKDSPENFEGQMMTFEQTVTPEGGVIGNAAAFSGTLTVSGDCLTLDGVPLLMPGHSSSWDGTTLSIGAYQFQLGDAVELAGGMVPLASMREAGRDDVLERCGDIEPIGVTGFDAPR